jgi:hypothetical protein
MIELIFPHLVRSLLKVPDEWFEVFLAPSWNVLI